MICMIKMMRTIVLPATAALLVLLPVVVLSGCSAEKPAAPAADDGPPPAAGESGAGTASSSIADKGPPVSEEPYRGLPTSIAWELRGRTSAVVATVQVRSGGWQVVLDRARPQANAVALYVTLSPPPPGAIVTQALETHRVEWTPGADADVASSAALSLYVREGGGDYRRAY